MSIVIRLFKLSGTGRDFVTVGAPSTIVDPWSTCTALRLVERLFYSFGRTFRVIQPQADKRKNPQKEAFAFIGAPETIRTSDLPLRRRLLYPAELPGRGRHYNLI
jgi:hypothetical protein